MFAQLPSSLRVGRRVGWPEGSPRGGAQGVAWGVVDEKGRIERIPYELCVLVALRDAIRRREILCRRRGSVAQPRG